MRWFWILFVLLLITAGGWYSYNHFYHPKIEIESSLIPSDAWLVYKSDTTNHENFILSELIATEILEDAKQIISESSSEDWLLYAREGENNVGLILYGEVHPPVSDIFTESFSNSAYTVLSNSTFPSESEHFNQELFSKAKKRSSRFCLLQTGSVLEKLNDYFPQFTHDLLRHFIEDGWATLNIQETQNLVQIEGVSSSRKDRTSIISSSVAFRYLPSQCNAALVVSIDSINSLIIASIPDEATGKAFTVLGTSNFENRMTDEAEYNGIKIGISELVTPPIPVNLDWTGEAYYADMGSFFLFAETDEQIRLLIDDYVADDVLTRSQFFKKLENYITDAQFSFYVRPAAHSLENQLVDVAQSDHDINSIIFQQHAEIPYQTFYNLAISRHEKLKDECPILWSLYADSDITGGPWKFKNHYSGKEEIVIQDSDNQLYLINGDGKTLWKKQLDEPVINKTQMIDLYGNGKYQLLLATASQVLIVDRNGNNVDGFPVPLKANPSAAPALVRYEKNGDARIIFGDGASIRNIDQSGKEVKGWKNPKLSNPLRLPVVHASFKNKDYLIALTKDDRLYFIDRRGKDRNPSRDLVEQLKNPEILIGSSLSGSYVFGHDTLGRTHIHSLNGDTFSKLILPVGNEVVAQVIDPQSKAIAILNGDHIYYRDGDGAVQLDYLLPETMSPEIDVIDVDRKWISMGGKSASNTYVIDLNGKMLDRMPVSGFGRPIVLDIDDNNVPELCVKSKGGELVLYQLTN